MKLVESINNVATGGLEPDLTILLDTDPETGLQRKRNSAADRFETENIAFHRKIREGYMDLAWKKPGRWLIVESGLTIELAGDKIWQRISRVLSSRHAPR
jgi:dTMP kinase